VFFGRFVALLRILAGPLAGALRMPYRRFLVANATGGIVWAFGNRLRDLPRPGVRPRKYLQDFSWIALVVAVLFGIATSLFLPPPGRRATRREADEDATTPPRHHHPFDPASCPVDHEVVDLV